MQKTILGVVAALVVVGGGWYFYMQKGEPLPALGADAGSYRYSCDNGSQFTMAPSDDVSSIKLSAGSQGMFAGEATLSKVGEGARYEGNVSGSPVVFVGAGEEVRLTVGSVTAVCNPVPSQELAPWNWGDAAEGGGSVKQDTSLIVTESMLGKWQSVDDAKYVREFKEKGVVVDWYDGKTVSTGLWVVFTKEKAPKIFPYTMDTSSVYLQLTMTGSQADTLNFKISKMTPEELQLVYLDRGGVLTFKRVQ